MRTEILNQGAFPVLEVHLTRGETIVAEAGAMTWMSDGIDCKTGTRGGILGGLKRRVLAGESLFQNEFSTQRAEAVVGLVPGQPGMIVGVELAGNDLVLERGAYLASTPGVTIDAKFQGLKGLFAEGLFVIRAHGKGPLFFSGYGDVTEVAVAGEYIVDNGHAVGWDGTLSYQVRRTRKIRAFLFGDQLLMHFHGHGRVWVQSRSPYPLAEFMHPYRPAKSN